MLDTTPMQFLVLFLVLAAGRRPDISPLHQSFRRGGGGDIQGAKFCTDLQHGLPSQVLHMGMLNFAATSNSYGNCLAT